MRTVGVRRPAADDPDEPSRPVDPSLLRRLNPVGRGMRRPRSLLPQRARARVKCDQVTQRNNERKTRDVRRRREKGENAAEGAS